MAQLVACLLRYGFNPRTSLGVEVHAFSPRIQVMEAEGSEVSRFSFEFETSLIYMRPCLKKGEGMFLHLTHYTDGTGEQVS